MNDLIKHTDGKFLTPNQFLVVLLANGKITETEDRFTLDVNVNEDCNLQHQLEKNMFPTITTQEEAKKLLTDALVSQYTVMYYSSRRLENEQSDETSS